MVGLSISRIGIGLGGSLSRVFNLSALFKDGEKGVIFDPLRVGTLYQTTDMQIPARVGDPVGMMLDQSQWGDTKLGDVYGPELVTNPSGSVFRDNAAPTVNYLPSINVVAGRFYSLTYRVTRNASTSSSSWRVNGAGGTTAGTSLNAGFVGVKSETLSALASGVLSLAADNSFVDLDVTDVSIREVTVASALEPIMGPELVTNGGFDTDTGWTKGAGWTISGGVSSGANTSTGLYQAIGMTVGAVYAIEFTVTAITGGNVKPQIIGGTSVTGTARSSSGRFVEYLAAASGNVGVHFVGVGFTGSIDNVSIREVTGHHATQETAAKRPTYGIHPKGGVRNLLTYTEDFSNAVWIKTAVTATSNSIVESTTASHQTVNRTFDPTDDTSYTVSVEVKPEARNKFYIRADYTSLTNWTGALFDLSAKTATVQTPSGSAYIGTAASITGPDADGYYRCSVSYTTKASLVSSNPFFGVTNGTPLANDNGVASYTGNGLTAVSIRKAQLEKGTTATAYQKVVSQYEVTEAGVPSVHYLSFDGVDDAMQTPSIDFTATDEMSVFAGVRKLSDSLGMLAELGAGGGGAMFYVVVGEDSASRYSSLANGTASQVVSQIGKFTAAGYAPDTAVITATHDISGDLSVIRRNGVAGVNGTGEKGTGNFRNDVMNIGSRNKTTLFFKGNLYALTVRGAATDDPTLANAETVTADKTGITL